MSQTVGVRQLQMPTRVGGLRVGAAWPWGPLSHRGAVCSPLPAGDATPRPGVANRCLASDPQAVACPWEELRHPCFQGSSACVCHWRARWLRGQCLPAAVEFRRRHFLQGSAGGLLSASVGHFPLADPHLRGVRLLRHQAGAPSPYLPEEEVMGAPLPTGTCSVAWLLSRCRCQASSSIHRWW